MGLRVTDGGKKYKPLRATKKEVKIRKKVSYVKWIALVVFALLLAIGVSTVFVFRASSISYEGEKHYTQEELNQLIFGTDRPNTLYYMLFGDKDKEIPFVEQYDVDIHWPKEMVVTIYEKPIVGYISYMGCNMYFDREGMIVESSTQDFIDVPEVYGLKFNSIVLGNKLDVGSKDMFMRILELTQSFDIYELDIDRIVFDSSYNVVLDVGDVRVELGNPKDSSDRLHILKQMMSSLSGLKGTLKLSDYDGTDKSIIFTKDKS